MKIRSMTAVFGCLDGATLSLSDGINLYALPNESGKSTWAAFVVAMFYGIDTTQRASKGLLPEKTRFQPWNGKAMSGTLELEHQGRTIVLQRTSQRGRPMSVFRAYDKTTGLELPELTGENCGMYFFGVEKSVFRRTAFLSGSELAVTEDQELARRLENLAVSGSMGDSFPAADAKLKQWKNRHRYHQNGLIPEKEAQLLQAEGRLERLTALRQETMATSSECESHKAEAELLEQREWSAWSRRKEQAAQKLAEVNMASQSAGQNGPVGWQETAPDSVLRQLHDGLLRLEHAPLPPEPMCPSALQGIEAEAILPKLQRDQDTYDRLTSGKEKNLRNALLPGIWSVVIFAAAVIGKVWWLLAVGLVFSAAAVLLGLHTRRENAKCAADRKAAEALLQSYGVSRKDDLLPAAMARRDWLQARSRHHAALWEVESLLGQLVSAPALETLSADQIRQELERRRGKADTGRALELAEAEYRAAHQPWHPSSDLMRLREKAAGLRAQAEGLQKQEEVSGGLERANYRCEQLQQELDDLYLREQALELAREALASAHSQLEQVYAPRLTGLAGRYLQSLTRGRYDALIMGRDWQLQAREQASGLARPLASLSSGTQDQVWLSLRLAMAELLLPADAPLVLDDALLTFDDARAEAALALLGQTGRQILLFSCKASGQVPKL